MSLVPLLPLFHLFNRKFFESSLTQRSIPMLSVRWSDGRLRKTAGFYRRVSNRMGQTKNEIVLSRPVLEYLPQSATESTLCHEMIHAWIDLVLKKEEAHGPNFHERMNFINEVQDKFQVTIRHRFPIPAQPPRWFGECPNCGLRFPYKRRVQNAACRYCCDTHYGGNWHASCMLSYIPALKES